ncbi:MAG: leucine-rich repeat protein [Rikenellaceae bacterium]
MKNKLQFRSFVATVVTLLALSISSCDIFLSEETSYSYDLDGSTPISGYDSSTLQQDFYADQTTPNYFSFSASESWRVDLSQTARSDDNYWVDVYPMSGEAGEQQLEIAINSENTTGEPRSMTITIVGESGYSPTTITVTQSAEPTPDESEDDDEDSDSAVESTDFTLADFASMTTPPTTDCWVITDESATVMSTDNFGDFAALRAMLSATVEDGRSIELVFPNLKELPNYAFENNNFYDCNSLVSVSLPQATSLGQRAFYCCGALTSVYLPEVTTVGSSAFTFCSTLTSVSLPKAKEIEDSTFWGCEKLTYVYAPSATSLGYMLFYACEQLNNFTIASTVTEIGAGVFSLCKKLTNLYNKSSSFILRDNILFDAAQTSVISSSASVSGHIDLPNSVTTIKELALSYLLSNDFSISGASVKEVERSAFGYSYCTSADFPNVTTIGSGAFVSCKFTSVDFPLVTAIESSTFYGCTYLTTVNLPAVTSVGESAFRYCRNLSIMYLASNEGAVLTSLGSNGVSAFDDLDTSQIFLCISLDNEDSINDKTLTIGGISVTFANNLLGLYAMGEVYYVDFEPAGMVYAVSNGGKNGKVVSFDSKFCWPETSNVGYGDQIGLPNEIWEWEDEYNAGGLEWQIPEYSDLKEIFLGKCGLDTEPDQWAFEEIIPNYYDYKDSIDQFDAKYEYFGYTMPVYTMSKSRSINEYGYLHYLVLNMGNGWTGNTFANGYILLISEF